MLLSYIRFKKYILPTLFFILVTSILMSLGFWQLNRYQFKKDLFSQYQASENQPYQAWNDFLLSTNKHYKKIWLKGHYLNQETILIAHRFYQSAPGVDVLTPFQTDDSNKVVMVKRGWLRAQDLEHYPEVDSILGEVVIKGWVQIIDKKQFILGDNIMDDKSPPFVVQRYDEQDIKKIIKRPLYNLILVLNQDQPGSYQSYQPYINVQPQKHLSYALQWFLMALAFIIIFFYHLIKRSRSVSCKRIKK